MQVWSVGAVRRHLRLAAWQLPQATSSRSAGTAWAGPRTKLSTALGQVRAQLDGLFVVSERRLLLVQEGADVRQARHDHPALTALLPMHTAVARC